MLYNPLVTLFSLFVYIFATLSTINAVSIYNLKALSPYNSYLSTNILGDSILLPANAREKRKGGGSKSSRGGRGGKLSRGGVLNLKPNLNARGETVSGLGVRPAYSGGRYYSRGVTYPYIYLYIFINKTVINTTFLNSINQTLSVNCLCQRYSIYGCDNNSDNIYLYNLVRNSNYAALNKTLVTISIINRTRIIAINGTLPNGTITSGGLDLLALNWWVIGAITVYLISFL
ncbi:hypothetical protein V2W45_1465048 [Cenococcum geophilum]